MEKTPIMSRVMLGIVLIFIVIKIEILRDNVTII